MFDLKRELDSSINICKAASQEILKIYNTDFTVEYKEDNSPVTEADRNSNFIIVSDLKNKFPDYAILSEESEDDKSRLENDWCWIIDPLDGTKEFLKKNGEFTINIGLAYKNRVVLGVVYQPVTDELYYASKGNGAFYKKNQALIKIHTTDKLNDLIMIMSRSHPSNEITDLIDRNRQKIKKIIKTGSSIKGCLVAKGDADLYYRYARSMEWDTAAMQCIVEEAGGIFKQMDDSEMLYNRKNSMNIKGFYAINRIENKLH